MTFGILMSNVVTLKTHLEFIAVHFHALKMSSVNILLNISFFVPRKIVIWVWNNMRLNK